MNPPKEDLKEKDRNGERKKGSGGGGAGKIWDLLCHCKKFGFCFHCNGKILQSFYQRE